ncbi:hypothetical protein [Paenibacillus massiliensis]|uniref:hypothetical protein n=1 Tax=Paenibacillus massiliensis TaxID=225917 RepID=UPI000366565A|nr:hypothetical protein [Paenibacillus massiliensis]
MSGRFSLLWGSILRLVAFMLGGMNPYLTMNWKIAVFALMCLAGIAEVNLERRPQWLSVFIAFLMGSLISYILLPVLQ